MTDIKQTIFDKILSYDKIIVSRHIRPDGDAVGSSKGLVEILRSSFPEKKIFLINEDYSDYLAFMGGEDEQIADEEYKDALAIVVDTGTADRISNSKIHLAKELVKIDHHIDDKPYGDVSWVEDEKSSTCELIVDFYLAFKDKLVINSKSATYLYTGLVTDSGRFKFGANGDALRSGAVLLDQGIDTASLYAHLYLDDYDKLKKESVFFNKVKMTENGVAYLYLSQRFQRKKHLTREVASSYVSIMDGIKNSIVWIAFIENGDGSTRVRLRSRFLPVQELATHYNGGGHEFASGATVYSKKEYKKLLHEADELVKQYKSTHKGWM